MSERTFGSGIIWVLNFLIGVIVAGPFRRCLFFQLLLFPPLLLTQQLLSFKHYPGVEAMASHVAVPGALIAGIPRVVFCTLETFARRIVLLPRILRHRACIFPALPENQNKVFIILHYTYVKHLFYFWKTFLVLLCLSMRH